MTAEIVSVKAIAQVIYLVRGQRVLLDRDLAALYGVETRVLNQAVKRNANRFPEDFMFRLSRQEIARISQSVTSLSGLKFSKQVHAFTEAGVAMLSSGSERDTNRVSCSGKSNARIWRAKEELTHFPPLSSLARRSLGLGG